ncbi:hypothetical protein PZ938_16895 [Luteipulveratus sp. YIM 133132]|uniref:hypothetical protein n=1 Tax=Luteipulveratus flavus TaxID=3031728 RepID=UPI0023B192CE|nr:hypothetical protein [Luteipulveratus sp. YIM 133132]MDE9367300.1 hypothetical protein [Luteipulveratus sp. YIM 133132]
MAGETGRLSRSGRMWRVAVLLAVAAAVTAGTLGEDDRSWPFAPMVQFAFKVDTNGEIHSLGIEAVDVTGRPLVVPLGGGGIGLERAEIEGQATRIENEPQRLQAIAVMWASYAPQRPRLATVHLVDTVSTLRDSTVVGKRRTTVATWSVAHPAQPGER